MTTKTINKLVKYVEILINVEKLDIYMRFIFL